MSNYNTQLQSNNTDLQTVLQTLQTKAAGKEPVLQDKTVTPTTSKQTITADSGYDGLDTVTVNAMTTATQATPSITINASGLITATATQTAGYVAAGTKSATKQLAFQAAKTITPTTANQTAVSSGYYTGGAVTVKGDSNLVAGNIKSGVSIFGVSGTYVGSGGDTSIEDGLVTKTLTSYTNNRVSSIGQHLFYSCSTLTSVNFPVCTNIGRYAFYSCSNLTSISFPACTTIEDNAFQYCSKLTSVSFPACTNILSNAFSSCSTLTSVNFPVCTGIGRYAFWLCSKLTSISFPVCTGIGQNAFRECSNLTSVSFPACIDIGQNAFSNCTKLATIYLTGSSLCSLANSNAFSYTGIWSNKGSIYVPASLVASYKAATNWAFFSNRIFSNPDGHSGGTV